MYNMIQLWSDEIFQTWMWCADVLAGRGCSGCFSHFLHCLINIFMYLFFGYFRTLTPIPYLRDGTVEPCPRCNWDSAVWPLPVARPCNTRERDTKRRRDGRGNRRREIHTSSLLLPLQGGSELCLAAAGPQQWWETAAVVKLSLLVLCLMLYWRDFISAQALSTKQCWRQGAGMGPSSLSRGRGSKPSWSCCLRCQRDSRTKRSTVRSAMCTLTQRRSSNRSAADVLSVTKLRGVFLLVKNEHSPLQTAVKASGEILDGKLQMSDIHFIIIPGYTLHWHPWISEVTLTSFIRFNSVPTQHTVHLSGREMIKEAGNRKNLNSATHI